MWMLLALGAMLGASGGSEITSHPGPQTLLQSLHCPPCERIHCSPRRALKLRCGGGVTTGVCGCCPACARTVGESCGGTWDYLGKCDRGLLCVTDLQDPATIEGRPDAAERRGVCKAVLESLDGASCRPECTLEFCQAKPSEICSARSVSLERQACQGPCQHTSCSACLVLRPPAPCSPQGCAPSDPACLRSYGSCVHSHMSATTHEPVCHYNLQTSAEGYFVCLVPGCPNTQD